MVSKKYDPVPNDETDTRVPVHPDEAFQHGITFPAKYIGTLDVPRPTSRVEIVAAMRKIRYEFKAKGVKKKKVTLEVSVDGVRVNLRRKKKKKNNFLEDKLTLMHHPIYRIFYVSHDSQDLKIFSYIAREGASNVFKCNVFKSTKKSQAMKIVRTVGQAFEVCHKLSVNTPSPQNENADPLNDLEGSSEKDSEAFSDPIRKDGLSDLLAEDDSVSNIDGGDNFDRLSPEQRHLDDMILPPTVKHKISTASAEDTSALNSPLLDLSMADVDDMPEAVTSGLSTHHELQLLREQLDQQCQQTQAAVAQVHLLRDQLAAETTARIEAQARTHQLLVHNKELLDHITALVTHLQDKENSKSKSGNHFSVIPQMYSDPTLTLLYSDMQDVSENRNSGAFVTAPSSPKQRHAPFYPPPQPQPTPQQMGSLYSLAYPTTEQQFQAQLLQRLTSLQYPPPILTPPIYQTLPYNFCGFPNYPSHPPRMEEPGPAPRLDPPPPSKKQAEMSKNSAPRRGAKSPTPGGGRTPPSPSRVNTKSPSPPRVQAKSPSPSRIQAKSPSPASAPPPPTSPKASYFASALSSIKTLRVSGGDRSGSGSGKKSVQLNGPGPITRATSEKGPNRCELMDQAARTAWARQTK